MTYAKGEQNAGNYENNVLSAELKINPKYEIQTRPHTSSEYKRLKDSMMEFGLKEPIRVDEAGYILDGHHRLKICKELGIEPQIVIVRCENEQQKIRLINQLNTARRHLTRWELYLTAEKPDELTFIMVNPCLYPLELFSRRRVIIPYVLRICG